MAQKVKVILIDDVDGAEATETVSFGLDGVQYEIDLHEENASKLREDFAHWVGHARRSGGRRKSGRASATRSSSDASKIRAWARENGFAVSDRGRVPAEVKEAYEKAH